MTFAGLGEIGQIALTVVQLDRAISFYRDQLGMSELFATETMAFFDCQGMRLMLSLPEADPQIGGAILYFRSQDIEADSETLRSRNVELLSQPHLVAEMADHDLWMTFFSDSEGNTLALMQEKPRAG